SVVYRPTEYILANLDGKSNTQRLAAMFNPLLVPFAERNGLYYEKTKQPKSRARKKEIGKSKIHVGKKKIG
ncbi:MAG: hypothetical protein FWD39_06465, partial [Clostridiales bacterium]|nr:hypothetical protein [Clostridiales bacterium]